MSTKFKILLVEDDANFGLVLRDYLQMNKYEVDLASNGKVGYNLFKTNVYDLCILDIMMPEMDGFSLAEEIAKANSKIPFIFLTAKSLKDDLVRGYKLGASDYLNKPFDPEILLLKIHAILNSFPSINVHTVKENYQFSHYTFYTRLRKLEVRGKTISLSPKESQLLILFIENKNTLVRRDDILKTIWNESNYFTARSMDVYINKLRKHFKDDANISLLNLRGEGFIFELKTDSSVIKSK